MQQHYHIGILALYTCLLASGRLRRIQLPPCLQRVFTICRCSAGYSARFVDVARLVAQRM